MFRRDYLVRMIEDMTQMIGKVLTLKQERKSTEALWEIDELLNRHFRLNSRLLNSLSVDDIIEMFRLGGVVEADKLQGVARMLREEAGVYGDKGDSDAAAVRLMKALHLYLYAYLSGADRELLNLPREIREVRKDTEVYRLPAGTERLLMAYSEAAGEYAKAEDSLFRLLQQGENVTAEGLALYDRLLQVDPGKLEAGNLPLEEVEEGRREWVRVTGLPEEPVLP